MMTDSKLNNACTATRGAIIYIIGIFMEQFESHGMWPVEWIIINFLPPATKNNALVMLVNIGSGGELLHDGTEPLPEPMLTLLQ